MAVNSPNSPRQKMINLMYLVFIAMLALNVSAEVLDGFGLVDNSLRNSSNTLTDRNNLIMEELEVYSLQNPEKAGDWFQKGLEVRNMTDSLTAYIQELKYKMVREADGKKADVNNIKRKDDLDAASIVMLSPIKGKGSELRNAIDNYRNNITKHVLNPARRSIIERSLSTQSETNKSWEALHFENMPLAAAVAILTKIENDIIAAEGDALENILNSIDIGDFRVNQLNAYVISESDIVFQGGQYNARVILSAEDTTKHPIMHINGATPTLSENNTFSLSANSTGTFPVDGYLEISGNDGIITKRNFNSTYTVIEPMATIAPSLMNVLYAGIDNEISISVPGIAPQGISATIKNGTITRKDNLWVARPNAVGQDVTISISAQTANGKTRQVTSREFRVRALPDPTPFISFQDANGNLVMFKGGVVTKSTLMNADGIGAAIDDGILNIPFRVLNFRTIFFDSMGNAIPEVSNGNQFSSRQKDQIRQLSRGKYFYISGVKAAGPDGTEREIAVMEIRIN
ncbi:MAG: gliding motility protein GldM [Fermentimonas sp.]|nr:gliding motility protein GldM [Fermentimonas sp.]